MLELCLNEKLVPSQKAALHLGDEIPFNPPLLDRSGEDERTDGCYGRLGDQHVPERNLSAESTLTGGGVEMDHACIPFLSKFHEFAYMCANCSYNFYFFVKLNSLKITNHVVH